MIFLLANLKLCRKNLREVTWANQRRLWRHKMAAVAGYKDRRWKRQTLTHKNNVVLPISCNGRGFKAVARTFYPQIWNYVEKTSTRLREPIRGERQLKKLRPFSDVTRWLPWWDTKTTNRRRERRISTTQEKRFSFKSFQREKFEGCAFVSNFENSDVT